MEQNARKAAASGMYEKLIALYPAAYLRAHREELLQNFHDLTTDSGSRRLLWAFVLTDFVTSLVAQYMEYIKKHRWAQLAGAVLALMVLFGALGTWQVLMLQRAHSTFENYAAFRGCSTITSRTDTEGTCTTSSGQSVTIVKYDDRWFLQGDLPVCMINIGSYCFIDQP